MVDTALAESDEYSQNLTIKSTQTSWVIDSKGKLKKLAPRVDLSKNKVLRKAKKRRLRVPRVGDDIIVTAYGQRGYPYQSGQKW